MADVGEAVIVAVRDLNIGLRKTATAYFISRKPSDKKFRPFRGRRKRQWGSCSCVRIRPPVLTLFLDEQTNTISRLTKKLQCVGSDYIKAMGELDKQGERSQSSLKQLQFQSDTVTTIDRELLFGNSEVGEILNLCEQLIVPKDAPVRWITKWFRKLCLLCHSGQEELRRVFVYNRPTAFLRTMRPGKCMTVMDAKLQMFSAPKTWKTLKLWFSFELLLGHYSLASRCVFLVLLFWGWLRFWRGTI